MKRIIGIKLNCINSTIKEAIAFLQDNEEKYKKICTVAKMLGGYDSLKDDIRDSIEWNTARNKNFKIKAIDTVNKGMFTEYHIILQGN